MDDHERAVLVGQMPNGMNSGKSVWHEPIDDASAGQFAAAKR